MIDQLIIGDKKSFDDFDASIKTRTISKPKKKSIRETVPFSNAVYDFSAINGEIYWEDRDLEYVLEIMADSPEQLEEKKATLDSWLMNITEEVLKDPHIKDYHFIATFDDIDEDDEDDVEKTTVTVKFKSYPYMIANDEKVFGYALAADREVSVLIDNESSHRITPTIQTDTALTVVLNDMTYSIPSGTITDDSFKFAPGVNTLKIKSAENGNVTFSFFEEVF